MSLSELDQARKQLAVMREQQDALVALLGELEMLARVNCQINDGSLMHKKIRAALAKAGVE